MPKSFFELDSKAALLITVYDALNMSDPGFTASAFFSDKDTKMFYPFDFMYTKIIHIT